MTDLSSFQEFATKLAEQAIATFQINRWQFGIDIKSDGSPVTDIDRLVERTIRDEIEKAYPDHNIIGEEYGNKNGSSNLTWIIDPIDGTRQFAAGLPNFGILIALCVDDAPKLGIICQPEIGDIYLGIETVGCWRNQEKIFSDKEQKIESVIVAISDPDAYPQKLYDTLDNIRAQSRWNVYDGGCMSFAALASGKIGAAICGPNLDNFDICALVPIVKSSGGVITDWQGAPLNLHSKGAIVASGNPELHSLLLSTLA